MTERNNPDQSDETDLIDRYVATVEAFVIEDLDRLVKNSWRRASKLFDISGVERKYQGDVRRVIGTVGPRLFQGSFGIAQRVAVEIDYAEVFPPEGESYLTPSCIGFYPLEGPVSRIAFEEGVVDPFASSLNVLIQFERWPIMKGVDKERALRLKIKHDKRVENYGLADLAGLNLSFYLDPRRE